MPKLKRKNVVEVDEHGDIIEYYLMNDEEIKNARNEGRYIITKTFEGLYQPKYDFESDEWREGLSQVEIEKLIKTNSSKSEKEELQAKLEKLEEEKRMTDLALLELVEKILG